MWQKEFTLYVLATEWKVLFMLGFLTYESSILKKYMSWKKNKRWLEPTLKSIFFFYFYTRNISGILVLFFFTIPIKDASMNSDLWIFLRTVKGIFPKTSPKIKPVLIYQIHISPCFFIVYVLMGWFYNMLTFAELLYAKVSLTIMISNYMLGLSLH